MMINTVCGITIEGQKKVSILDSAFNAGLVFEYSCKNGQCGVCKTTLLEGEVEELQPQIALSDKDRENRQILTCCCAPVTDVLIAAEDLTALKDIEIKTLPVRISQLKKLSNNIIEVILRYPASTNFRFLEGQYIDVIWGGVRRSYSIASTAIETEVTLLIKKVEQGLMSNYWFNQAKANDLLRIEGPKGTFFLRDTVKPLVFMATGSGIAPIMAILKQLDEDSNFNQRQDIHLFWGNRFAEDFVWQPDFKSIRVDVELVVSKADKNWAGKMGYIQKIALDKLGQNIKNSDIYACGSITMIQSAKQSFIQAGLEEKRFYSDAFVQS